MKIADYGKAITSYIESPTLEQKNKLKTKAILLAERDNFNTPDLEQAPDSYLKPGETLEDFDVTFRRPNSTGGRVQLADGTTPKEKPFTLNEFKDKADIYMAAYAGNALPVNDIRLALDKFTKQGIADGTFTADEAIKVVKDLKSYYQDLSQKQRLRGVVEGIGDVEREEFQKGGDTSPVYNEKTGHIYKKGNRFGIFYSKTPPKNQFTAIRPLRSLEELQKIIDEAPLLEINGKFFEQNAKDLEGRSEYSSKELISRKELDKYRDKLKFKSKGKKRIEEVNQGNINRRNKIITAQGSEIPIKGGQKINRAFSHVYPIIESAKPGTKTTTVIDADMNNKLIGYNIIGQEIAEDQEYLLKVKPEGYKKQILINNAKAKKNVMNAIQDLGKKYKGQIGYFQVDPETGVFKPKAGNYKMSFAGLEGEDKIYKDMTSKERTAFSKKISDIEKLKTIPGVTTADKLLSKIGKGAKLIGKVIKPVGYAMGPYALASANLKADEMGIELNLMDKIKAFDSGDADVAIDSYKRRNDPEYAAEQRAKDLAKMSDDFEEVGKNTTFGKYNDQIKNTKLP